MDAAKIQEGAANYIKSMQETGGSELLEAITAMLAKKAAETAQPSTPNKEAPQLTKEDTEMAQQMGQQAAANQATTKHPKKSQPDQPSTNKAPQNKEGAEEDDLFGDSS